MFMSFCATSLSSKGVMIQKARRLEDPGLACVHDVQAPTIAKLTRRALENDEYKQSNPQRSTTRARVGLVSVASHREIVHAVHTS